jgi:hypothetical protein
MNYVSVSFDRPAVTSLAQYLAILPLDAEWAGVSKEEAMRTLRRVGLWAGGCLLAAAAPVAMAQMRQTPCTTPGCSSDGGFGMPGGVSGGRRGGAQQTPQQPGSIAPETGPLDPRIEHYQAKLRNSDRQKQLVADTQKLVALANELKSDVEKSNKDTLSMDVIRKADEIEKLAKSVRDKMKGS